MSAIFTILTVLIVIASILLTIVVLLQNGKGDGHGQ
jgi:protein translocase SecG subunit